MDILNIKQKEQWEAVKVIDDSDELAFERCARELGEWLGVPVRAQHSASEPGKHNDTSYIYIDAGKYGGALHAYQGYYVIHTNDGNVLALNEAEFRSRFVLQTEPEYLVLFIDDAGSLRRKVLPKSLVKLAVEGVGASGIVVSISEIPSYPQGAALHGLKQNILHTAIYAR